MFCRIVTRMKFSKYNKSLFPRATERSVFWHIFLVYKVSLLNNFKTFRNELYITYPRIKIQYVLTKQYKYLIVY